jgi:hypothetical protein
MKDIDFSVNRGPEGLTCGNTPVVITDTAPTIDLRKYISNKPDVIIVDSMTHHREREDCADELDLIHADSLSFLRKRLRNKPLPEKHGYSISRPNDLIHADFAALELKMYQNLKNSHGAKYQNLKYNLYESKYMKPNGYRFYPTMLAVQIALLCGFELKTYIEVSYAGNK